MIITSLAEVTDEIGEKFGAIGVTEMRGDLIGAKAEALALGFEFDDVADTITTLSSEFGFTTDEIKGMTTGVLDTAKALGLTTENAAQLVGILMSVTDMSAEETQNFMKTAELIATAAGVAPGIVTADMADSAEEIAGFSKDTGENMIRAASKAAQLGMSLADVAEIAESLLDFQTSIEAEMEASMMIGRQLNLQRARELALAGDLSGMMDAVLDQLGGEAEFNRLNVLQRKSIADALGTTVAQMSELFKRSGKTTNQLMRMSAVTDDMLEDIVGPEAISNITWLGNQFKVWGTKLLAKVAGWLDENKSLVMEMADGIKTFVTWLGKGVAFLAEQWKYVAFITGAILSWKVIKGIFTGVQTGIGLFKSLGDNAEKVSKNVPKPGAGTGLGSLSEGLKKMGTGKVLFGALNLIPAAIGMVAIIPGIPAIMFFGKAKLNKLATNLSSLAFGLTSLGTGRVTAGAANLILIGIGGLAAIGAIPFLSYMMIPTLLNLDATMPALALGLTSLGAGTVTAGAGNLALIGIGGLAAIAAIPFLSFIGLFGGGISVGLTALARGLTALGGAGVAGLIGVGLIAALGVAMIPFGYALSLVAPFFKEVVIAFEKLAPLGTDLFTVAAALGLVGLSLSTLGVGGILSGIFAGAALGQIETLASFSDPLTQTATAFTNITTSISSMEPSITIVNGMTIALSGLADSLAQINSQGFLALPILGTLATLGAIHTLIAGTAEPAGESEVHDKVVDGKIKTLTGEIVGLRSDMKEYFADDKLSIAMSRKFASNLRAIG